MYDFFAGVHCPSVV